MSNKKELFNIDLRFSEVSSITLLLPILSSNAYSLNEENALTLSALVKHSKDILALLKFVNEILVSNVNPILGT